MSTPSAWPSRRPATRRRRSGHGLPPPPPCRPPPPPVQERGAGWLSDLLARASREEPAVEPRRPVIPLVAPTASAPPARQAVRGLESLDSITRDIARMVDHDATADVWQRHQSGERNVFSRRLYTAQGQQTFEEIRRRYRSDADFADTVDRYIHEFERLLAEVGREDHDGSLMRTYLTSETGKVYTMLAHASGRFD